MTALVWDAVGERRYEAGVDRGVLFVPGGPVVPWNGLTSVSEESTREVKEYYLDGVPFLEEYFPNKFSARLQAYTYPDQLEDMFGLAPHAPGMLLHDQPNKFFSLSYRTKVGNDLDADHAYKLHILYNVRANPSGTTHNTLAGGAFNGSMLEWTLTGLPALITARSPTNHISLNSRTIDPALLEEIEDLIYGTEAFDPTLPSLDALLALA